MLKMLSHVHLFGNGRKSSTLLCSVYYGICQRNAIGLHQIPRDERGHVDPNVIRQLRHLDCVGRQSGDMKRISSDEESARSLEAKHKKGGAAVLQWIRRLAGRDYPQLAKPGPVETTTRLRNSFASSTKPKIVTPETIVSTILRSASSLLFRTRRPE
jgi:hypothetical protein